ncbi:ead/Ea22-like family protein [Escherichia coli]|uniref:ead/Ea22-like family protein n=2 Tax=Escherichia coli TaxID=562 RepID=UPI00017A9988|nr:ead/Ea22-like family protein [Escherichia coli]EAC0123773.1 ead/Ea22-like family protein [Shigella sonnei]EDX36899.1 gp41 [Escherichia coli 101-1]MCZ8799105.1 ead/Ea22-like family protein [Escherichia albertii]EHK3821024.1 ead/Ea22-like family protein [Escherichia coli]EHW6062890.1 ead/Ea22-like family protein [Escherichia coli]
MCKTNYQALRERYSPIQVPECPVCGDEMSIQRIFSRTHIVYACAGEGDDGYFKTGRTFADEHYLKSRVTVVDVSDPDVLALLKELEVKDKRIAELTDALTQMINAHKTTIRFGHERITECGGDCDSPEKMISENPDIRMAEAVLRAGIKTE